MAKGDATEQVREEPVLRKHSRWGPRRGSQETTDRARKDR